MKDPDSLILTVALAYVSADNNALRRRLYIFPAKSNKEGGYYSKNYDEYGHRWGATNNPEKIRDYWRRHPNALIGIPTGLDNRIWVLDVDTLEGHGKDGIGTLRALEAKHGKLPDTLMAQSPSGSIHYYFNLPPGVPIKVAAGKGGWGIDVKGEGGMVIAPPSTRKGVAYCWRNDKPIVDAPDWLVEIVKVKREDYSSGDTDNNEWNYDYNPEWEALIKPDVGKGAYREFPPLTEAKLTAAVMAMLNIPYLNNENIWENDKQKGWDDWKNKLMVIYAATREANLKLEVGLKLAHMFSKKGGEIYDAATTDKEWKNICDCPPYKYHTGTLIHLANEGDPEWETKFDGQGKQGDQGPGTPDDGGHHAQQQNDDDDSINANDLLRKEFPPIKFIVPDYIVEGLTIGAGKPKGGKSWWAYDICIAVALGGYAMGEIKCEQGDVLYLCLEDNQRRVKERIKTVCPDIERAGVSLDRLTIRTKAPKLNAGLLKEFDKWRSKCTNPRLIFIDTWIKVRPPRQRNADMYQADYDAAAPLQRYALQHNIGIVIITHTRKMEADDPIESVNGTNGITGVADSVLVFMRKAEGRILYGRGRDIAEIEKAMKFDRGLWAILGNVEDVMMTEQRRKILATIKEAGRPLSPKEISDLSGISHGNVRTMVLRMGRAGEIISKGGKYEPAPEQPDLY
jgi:bifunctional DNA primase/polymerase-like protein/AAA domain-containing protein/winged helix-turn-helix DNA-binding protein